MHDDTRATLERLVKGTQANFDHLSGEHKSNARVFNQAMEQVEDTVNDLLSQIASLEARIVALGG